MALTLSTFNCRGIQDTFKRKKIFHYLRSVKSDIIFLQETHSTLNDESFWKTQWGAQAWFSSYASNSRGVAILISNSVSVQVNSILKDPGGRFLIMSINMNGSPVILANIYAPNNDNPQFYLDVFAHLDKFDQSCLIVGGDLNLVLGDLDYSGSRSCHSNVNAREIVNSLMEEFNLIDVWRHYHPTLRQYTRHQHNPKVLSRLDYILISENLMGGCLKSKIIPGVNSDHSVVQLTFNIDKNPRGRGYWKLNVSYLQRDADFIKFIKDKIVDFKANHQNVNCSPNIIWDAFKCTITGYCMEYTSRKKKERVSSKNDLYKKIDEIKNKLAGGLDSDACADLTKELMDLEAQLNKIVDFETEGLITRSRCRWAEEGEKSSKYFCNLEKRMSEKKSINRIRTADQSIVTDKNKVLEEIQNFYDKLYSDVNRCHFNSEGTCCNRLLDSLNIPKLSDENKSLLDQPLTKNEVFRTISSMNLNKSPGLDGLPVEFYVVFWKDISDMLLDSFNYSFENGLLSLSQRNGVVVLLPKKDKDLLDIKNYRPISLLSVDYKIIAKTMANRLKNCIDSLIHSDQSGFLKGRNIGNNVRLLLDVIDYTKINDLPAAVLMLDIEKAFDSVRHEFLFTVLEYFNFGENFIQWVKTFYSSRKSYVMNNGFLSNSINMDKGIFQGCPISPYLFLFVMEVLAIAIRENPDIKGIKVNDTELKVSMLADDTTCFVDGSKESFENLFATLDIFGKFSGCKINMSKSESIWIGSKKGVQDFPYQDQGLKWVSGKFKCLGIMFSLNSNALFELNFKPKLKQIEQTLNCWRARGLSIIGKICVIKTLLLPQLLYLFSVLCIKLPDSLFKTLNKLFFNFIWNGGNDRIKRDYLCLDYSLGGLRMVDVKCFAQAQKMVWVKHLLDDSYNSMWKSIELSFLYNFHPDLKILWKSHAPEKVLSQLSSVQLSDSIRSWYFFRERAVDDLGMEFQEIRSQKSTCIWFNKYIRSKSKQYFYYASWYEKGIYTLKDLLYDGLPNPVFKSFDDLIIEFDIPYKDRRKYNTLFENVINCGLLDDFSDQDFDTFDIFSNNLILAPKVPRYTYHILKKKVPPEKYQNYWENIFADSGDNDDPDVEWDEIHERNFKCTIETQLRAFYVKLFYKAIAFNSFLFKIGRKDSPLCIFCSNSPETVLHVFCECEKVRPLWDELLQLINDKLNADYLFDNFDLMFGVSDDSFVTFLILCCKFYIYRCKFQEVEPNFTAFKRFIITKRKTEYCIAKKKGKLSRHFEKWALDLN